MKPNIELNIDKLVLEGFSRNDGFYISQSLQAELLHLIEKRNVKNSFPQMGHQRKLTTTPIRIHSLSRPEHIGKQIAQSIFSGLSTEAVKNK